jgi:dienelactone hydrolase
MAAACGLVGSYSLAAAAEPSAYRGLKPEAVEPAGPAPPLCVYQEAAQRQQARAMLGAYVTKALEPVAEARQRALAALTTPDAWRRRQQDVRQRLHEFLGDFGPRFSLDARTVSKLDRPDYVIEKVIFQSQPGYFCTANLYLPKRREFPRPGVLLTCGHAAEGKAYQLYHEACLGLVLKGYVVLALDPTGQGERSEYFDPTSGKPLVPLTVSQHHYLARPSWLVGRTLAGYRTWDAIRAVDYLVSRPEVDPEQIGATGNSGGGIMGLLITACDERVKVCAVDHPGGSCEQTFLTGQRLTEADILSLIPPRPCAIVVGRDSGEILGHQAKLDDMLPFYRGLGADPGRAQFAKSGRSGG